LERKKVSNISKPSRRVVGAATPHQLVGMAYELAIKACEREEAARSEKAILRLRNVMRSVGPEDSADLMKFYDWCLDQIGRGEFAMAAQTLSDLWKAWNAAERRFSG
jgi:flagellin-specific chaperone FliS